MTASSPPSPDPDRRRAHPLLRTDDRLAQLGGRMDPPEAFQPEGEPPTQAAVALVLRGGDDLELLLIKRAESERDPWSGHMALPGGRREEEDGGLWHTAKRETLEETGLNLTSGVTLGQLPPVSPKGPASPLLSVSPFVFAVPSGSRALAASPEVDWLEWVSLRTLREPSRSGTFEIVYRGATRAFPSYLVRGEHVWGLTYRILEHFFERYDSVEGLTRGSPHR